jgi:purine catabolism regulator
MPTVEEVWQQALPPGTVLVAGEGGLFAEVTWVVTLKSAPPGFDSLKGGELALVGAGVGPRLGVPLSRLLTSIAERGVSAICLLGQAPPEVRERAALLELPLLQLPPQSNLPALESRVSRLITEGQVRLYRRDRELSRVLMEPALAGKGLAAILRKLQALTGRESALLGRHFEPLSPLAAETAGWLLRAQHQALGRLRRSSTTAAQRSVIGLKLTSELSCFLGPVLVGSEPEGYLALIGSQLQDTDRLAVRVGALALAIEMARRRAAREAEDRLQVEVVEALISGDFPSPQTITERARRLGLDLSRPYVAMALQVKGSPYREGTMAREAASALKGAWCHCRADGLVVLYPVAANANLRGLGREVARKLSSCLEGTVAVGVGRSYPGPEGIRLSFQESARALALGARLFGESSVTFFADLGVYRLLFSLAPGGELEAFCQEYLGRLAEYDRKRGGGLMRTLEAWLRHGTIAQTARALHVHRNTLLYRLERIQDITGLDLEDGETRLNLYVAVRCSETLRACSVQG